MIPSDLSEHRAIEFTAAELADAVTACFEGYIMTFSIDALGFERRFRPEGLDAMSSVVLKFGNQFAAVCLIARQGWTSRVAAMAIAPYYRRRGVGRHLMNLVIEEATARNDDRLVLEVIEQNPAAIALYESVGLKKTRRLAGYRREPSKGTPAVMQIVDPSFIVRKLMTNTDPGLPWDFKPETLALKAAPTKGLSLAEQAFALISDAQPERVILWTLLTSKEARRMGKGTQMIEAIAAMYPNKALVTPVALPDDHAKEFLTALGFKEVSISQFEMAIELKR